MAQHFEQPLSDDLVFAPRVSFDGDTGEVELICHDELIKLKPDAALKLLTWLLERKFLLRKQILRQDPWDGGEGA